MVGNPIKVSQYKSPIRNPRHQLFEEESSKIIGKKGMIMKGHLSEKDRIDKIVEENKSRTITTESSDNKAKKK